MKLLVACAAALAVVQGKTHTHFTKSLGEVQKALDDIAHATGDDLEKDPQTTQFKTFLLEQPGVCQLKEFCKDENVVVAGDSTGIHYHDFCITRKSGPECGIASEARTGARLCMVYAMHADCGGGGQAADTHDGRPCDGLLRDQELDWMCADLRGNNQYGGPGFSPERVCSTDEFCQRFIGNMANAEKTGVPYSFDAEPEQYKTPTGFCTQYNANDCSVPNERGNGLRLCKAMAVHLDCNMGGGCLGIKHAKLATLCSDSIADVVPEQIAPGIPIDSIPDVVPGAESPRSA